MVVPWDKFWCRVLFKEFIKHFRKLNDDQIVRDIRQSMDDLEDMVDDTDTFGSQMVRWANERAEEPFATAARENGKKGGRPRKNPSGPMPSEKEPVLDYAAERELDEADAYNCWYVTVKERGGCDADGNPVNDWKSFVKKWCATADKNRKRNKGNQQ